MPHEDVEKARDEAVPCTNGVLEDGISLMVGLFIIASNKFSFCIQSKRRVRLTNKLFSRNSEVDHLYKQRERNN